MARLNKKEWFNLGRWVQPPISGCFWCYWNTKSTKEAMDFDFDYGMFLDGHTLVKIKDQKFIDKYIEQLYKKKKINSFINHLEKVCKKYEQQHLAVLKNDSKNITKYLTNVFDTYRELLGLWLMVILIGDSIQNFALKNEIATEQDMLEAHQYGKKTWLEEQSADIFKLANEWKKISSNKITLQSLKKYPALYKKIKNHAEKYNWFGTHHWVQQGYSLSKCLIDINYELSRDVRKVHINKNKKLSVILQLLNSCTYWRTHCAEVCIEVVYNSRPILTKAAKKFKLSYDHLTLLSDHEIINLLENPKKKLPANFKQRAKAYGCYIINGKEYMVSGKEFNKILNLIVEQKKEISKELKGVVASKGKTVKGKVRLVIKPQDVGTFKDSEILVATETTPDFVPCMKKAVAIITNRGGITSHAAVVSRELGVPCIIGTQVATEVLKNGDLVEVDTQKGIINIL